MCLPCAGKAQFVVTQNVDGLDQRAGLPRGNLAVLHGCIFEEKCEDCAAIYLRDTDVGSISFAPTGRRCAAHAACAACAACAARAACAACGNHAAALCARLCVPGATRLAASLHTLGLCANPVCQPCVCANPVCPQVRGV